MSARSTAQEGFTLIELLIVLIVIGILAAIAIPTYLSQRNNAKDAAVKEGIHTLQIGVQSYAVDHADTYPATGALDALRDGYVDTWPQDPFNEGDMAYSATPEPGSYAYTSTGTTYKLTGWLSGGSFDVPGGDAEASTFTTKTDFLIKLVLDYYTANDRWPRSWDPYAYTDLGLDPDDYAAPVDGLYYKLRGSQLAVRPAEGTVMTMTDVNGDTRVMTNDLNWNVVYDATTGTWYYHSIDPANEVDISSLAITQS